MAKLVYELATGKILAIGGEVTGLAQYGHGETFVENSNLPVNFDKFASIGKWIVNTSTKQLQEVEGWTEPVISAAARPI